MRPSVKEIAQLKILRKILHLNLVVNNDVVILTLITSVSMPPEMNGASYNCLQI